MNIQVLPNWCKKVGVSMFIVFVIIGGVNEAVCGYQSYKPNEVLNTEKTEEVKKPDNDITKETVYFGENVSHLFSILSIAGMIIYMMSKEKVEDDYINKLRLDSFQLSTLIFLFVCLIVYIISGNLRMSLGDYMETYLVLYLVIFFIKKRIY